MPKFEHTSVVFHIEEKNFTLASKDILQGLTEESSRSLLSLSEDGWELVSVVRYSSGMGSTDALLAFFKRPRS